MPKIHRDRPPTNRYDVVAQVPQPEPESEAETLQPPSRTALRSVWVVYAESLGVDSSGTKLQIIARVVDA